MAQPAPSDVPIRPAATVVLARDTDSAALEVLMVRRNRNAVFLGGAHVFPGGGVDPVDDSPLARAAITWSGDEEEFKWRAAALRELFEEAGVLLGSSATVDPEAQGADFYEALVEQRIALDAGAMEYFANWVTPLGPPRRFDARFYVAAASADAITDDREVFDPEWISPDAALQLEAQGTWFLEHPTRATLEALASHESTGTLMRSAAATDVEQIAPRIAVDDDGSVRVLLPGDPGFDEAPV